MFSSHVLAGVAAAVLSTSAASAATVGFFSNNLGANAEAESATTTAGHSFASLLDLTAGSLAAIDVLWVANTDNDNQIPAIAADFAAISAFVTAGGVFVYNDREVGNAAASLPGGAGTILTNDFDDDIEVIDASTGLTNGPGGVIDNSTLDGGTFSSHGYATLGSLPAGAVAILSRGDGSEVVDFTYAFGAGFVHFSTIPIDYYLAGTGSQASFNNIYAPNLVAYAASLSSKQPTPVIPLPASLPLLLGGLAGFAVLRRRH